MGRKIQVFFLCVILGYPVFCYAAESDFSNVNIDKAYYPYLTAKKVFMLNSGVKEFFPPERKERILVCIVSMPSKGKSASAFAKMSKICRIKAQSELLRADGCEISAFQKVEEKIISVDDGHNVKIQSVSSFLDIAEEKVRGQVRCWPIIGTWYSKDGTEFFLAIGTIQKKKVEKP